MAKALTYIITILVLLALNIAFPPIARGVPNFLFLLVLFYAFRDDGDFLWLAFFSGLCLDALGMHFFGTYMLAFLLIGIGVNYATRTFFTSDPSVAFMSSAVAVASLVLIALVYGLNALAFQVHLSGLSAALPVSSEYLRAKVWLDLLLNLIFALPIFLLTELNDKIIARFERRKTSPF